MSVYKWLFLAGCAVFPGASDSSLGQEFQPAPSEFALSGTPPGYFQAAPSAMARPLQSDTGWQGLRLVDFQNEALYEAEQAPADGDYFACELCSPFRSGFYIGAEAVIVKPYFEDEVDTVRTIVIEPGEIFDMEVQLDPNYDHALTPRLVAGYRWCSGLGLRARYWVFEQSANPLSMSMDLGPIVATESLTAALNVRALDAEFTKLIWSGPFKLELAGGARFGKVETSAASSETFLFDDGTTFSQATIGNADFEGVGPTVAIEGRHCLGHLPVNVFANLRGSLLFGRTTFVRADTDSDSPDGGATDLIRGSDDVVPVIESQVGLEYSRAYHCGVLSARLAMEAQWWGVATPGAGLPGELNQPLMRDEQSTDRDLGFFGVAVGIGYNW